MAVSRDGYVARSPEDDMSWLGKTDKAIFRILTGVGQECAISAWSCHLIPGNEGRLPGRSLHPLSREGFHHADEENGKLGAWGTLDEFYNAHPDGWLLGGQALAIDALEARYVDEVHLCRSDRSAFPDPKLAMADELTGWLRARPFRPGREEWWANDMNTIINDVRVECWRRQRREQRE